MPIDLLMQETKGLSDEAIMEVVRFIRFMKMESMVLPMGSDAPKASDGKPQLRRAGVLKGQIKMASDFDAPLDDFREYM